MFFSRALPVAILSILLAACGGSEAKQTAAKTVEDRFAIKIGDRTVQMQIAALPSELEKGLMFRKTMGEDEGMLFVFTRPQAMGFWMRNCEFPQTIGYFGPSGELKEMYDMYPHDEKTVSSRSRNIQFCLEMNQGWYQRHDIKTGAKLDLKAVAEALRARGLKALDAGAPDLPP